MSNDPPAPPNKRSARTELELVTKRLQLASLADDHPVRTLFERQTERSAAAEATFKICHLASDLRTIEGVPGATDLVRALINDKQHFEDYRYELRLAGSAARSPGQKLLRLGGKSRGPDIELITQSGHRCGIACFRANPVTPNLQNSGTVNADLVTDIAVAVGSRPIAARNSIEIRFDDFPMRPESRQAAIEAFEELWDWGGGQISRHGVTVSRTRFEPSDSRWEVRISLLLPVPQQEKRRIADKIRDKVAAETKAWAASYEGVPVFAVEETDFALGVSEEFLQATVGPDAAHPFAAVLKTWPYFVDHEHGGRCLVEKVTWSARPSLGGGVRLNLATFGLNSLQLEEGHLLLEMHPQHATEEWVLSPRTLHASLPDCVDIKCAQGLSLVRRMARVPHEAAQKITHEQIAPVVAAWFPNGK